MKKYIYLLFFIISITTNAQQNFFNVASSDITKKNKVFFQQQINLFAGELQSNTTFNYGLGKNTEIGLNLIGINIDKNPNGKIIFATNEIVSPYSPFLLLNGQKKININENFSIASGFQQGFTIDKRKINGYYYYFNNIYDNENYGLKFVFGLYLGSKSFLGEGKRLTTSDGIGVQCGFEKSIIKDKLIFQSDFISGAHTLGEIVLGGAYFLNKKNILSLGYQVPTFNSLSKNSIVFELTIIP